MLLRNSLLVFCKHLKPLISKGDLFFNIYPTTQIQFCALTGLAYKEGDQSKFKIGQNARTNAAKRTLSESTSTPSVVSTPSNSQRPENDNISHTPSQNQSFSRPKPPPPKKAHVVPSESPTHPVNTDSDDLFVVVDTKMESELDSDHMEDQLDNNGPEWASLVCVIEWQNFSY